jgi:undecaprenyl-diphosphatase
MESHLHALIAYFSAHPQLALGAIFAASLLEALAVIGTVIPGSAIVFAAGMLIGLGELNPWWAAAMAVSGAILGDGISYWLGQHFQDRIRTVWPLNKFPALFERGQLYFEKNGGKSVFLARFLGPVRAIVPVVAGMTGMPAKQFYAMNLLSALAWAAVHLLPGLLFGASLQLAGAVSSRLVVMLLIIAAFLWAISKLVQIAYHRGWPRVTSLRDRAVALAHEKPGPFASVTLSLLDPARAASPALLTAALLLIGGAWLFLGIVEDVISNDPLIQIDQMIYGALQGLRTVWGDRFMVAVTEVGGAVGAAFLISGVSLLLAIGRRWRTLGYWLAAIGIAEMLVLVLKYTLGRARPHNIDTGLAQFSFPSGHATSSIVAYGFLAFLLARGRSDRGKMAITLLAAAVITLIGFSRLYLGVHWFSDVVAGMSLGLAWVALLSIAYIHHAADERVKPWPLLLVTLAALGLTASFYAGDRYRAEVERYAFRPALQTVPLDDWTGAGWRQLPASRSELDGEMEEPFALQWAGTAPQMADTLRASGWQTPETWTLKSSLLWLLPTAQIQQLPVLPKFNHGEAPKITFVKVLGTDERLVLRLWPLGREVRPDRALPARPLWIGMVATERLHHPGGTITLARTGKDFRMPLRVLTQDLQSRHRSVQRREKPDNVVWLVW